MSSHITTADAQQQRLSGSDVYRYSHLLYYDDHHRDWGVVRLNIEALKAFSDTVIIGQRKELAAHQVEVEEFDKKGGLAANLPFPWNAAWHDTMEYMNYENLKIASGFELHLKARLLARGFLLHEIDPTVPGCKILAAEQTDHPIKKEQLLALQSYHFDGSQNYLPGLKESSLKFSWLTDKPSYRAALDLTEAQLAIVKDYRLLRNQIHFPGDIVVTPGIEAFGGSITQFLIPFINTEIAEWSNKLIKEHQFTFRLLPAFD